MGVFKEESKKCRENIRAMDLLEEERVLSDNEKLIRESGQKEFQIRVLKEERFWRLKINDRLAKGG